jgi:hypothetical protein
LNDSGIKIELTERFKLLLINQKLKWGQAHGLPRFGAAESVEAKAARPFRVPLSRRWFWEMQKTYVTLYKPLKLKKPDVIRFL